MIEYGVAYELSAAGTWASDTKLSSPVQTTRIRCARRPSGAHCIEATAQIGFDTISVDINQFDRDLVS